MSNFIPGLDILGKGYDVFGRFAHPSGVFNVRLFQDLTTIPSEEDQAATYSSNINQIDYDIPYLVNFVEENTAETSYIQGSSISNFQSELDVKVSAKGKYSFYKGEAKFGFNMSQQSSQELYYSRFSNLAKAYRLALPGNERLRAILDEDFQNDLENGENSQEAIDAFFKRYGTHFLAEVVLGGCNNYYATVEKSAVSSDLEIKASVKASYNSLTTSASVSVDSSYTSSASEEATHSETGIETVGGDISKAGRMHNDDTAYKEWLDSIMTDPALIAFTSQSLRPIWELLDANDEANQARIAALETRFNEISGVSMAINTQGTVKHGDAVYPPWGKKEDWNLFLSPAILGRSEGSNSKDVDNAIMNFEYGLDTDFEYDDHWQVKAKYRYRTAKDVNQIRWYKDGLLNYILIPKKSYIYMSPATLGYSSFVEEKNQLWLTDDQGEFNKVYDYDPDKHELTDADGEIAFEDMYYQSGSFYQYRLVSKVQYDLKYEEYEIPGGSDLDDWNLLASPSNLSYREDNPDHEKDNALIRWDWSDHYSSLRGAVGDTTTGFSFNSTVKYRKGESGDHVINTDALYNLLWVHKDFSFKTGAYGNQSLQLPENELLADKWMLAISPVSMGDYEESEDSELKNSALLQTKCTASRSDTNWTVNSSYLWSGDYNYSDQVAWESGQAECLFIRSNVLEYTSLD